MDWTWIALLYLVIVGTLNGLIDYDMRNISEDMTSLPLSASLLNIATCGLYSILYFKGRANIKIGFDLLIYLLLNMDSGLDDEYISKYIEYKNHKYQPYSPIYATLLNEIKRKIINDDNVDEEIKMTIMKLA